MGNSRIQFRRGKAAFWTDENPILHSGEPGLEVDTNKYKIGDGSTPWRELEYSSQAYQGEQGLPGETGGPGPIGPAGATGPTGPSGTAVGLPEHVISETPHPIYDDGRDFFLLYENAKV